MFVKHTDDLEIFTARFVSENVGPHLQLDLHSKHQE